MEGRWGRYQERGEGKLKGRKRKVRGMEGYRIKDAQGLNSKKKKK